MVLQNTREILSELGYRVLDLEEKSNKESDEAGAKPLSLYFRTPEKGVVRLACGLVNSLFSEFIQLKKKGGDYPAGEAGGHRCEQWCRDYDFLLHELSSQNIRIEENWRESPALEQCRVMEVSEEYLKVGKRVAPIVRTKRENIQNS